MLFKEIFKLMPNFYKLNKIMDVNKILCFLRRGLKCHISPLRYKWNLEHIIIQKYIAPCTGKH